MRVLADVVLFVHASFVAFVVFGQVFILTGWWGAWRWTRNLWFRLLHLVAIGVVMLEAWFGIPCPLTVLENSLRRSSSGTIYETSFIGHWLQYLIFYEATAASFLWMYTGFFALVVVSLVAYPPRRH